jgi:hypothetical protein
MLLIRLFLLPLLVMAQVAELRQIWPILERAGCRGCHNPDGVASATRLRFPEGMSDEELAGFAASLRQLLDLKAPDQSLLVMKPTARVAHAGGRRIQAGSAEEQALVGLATRLARAPAVTAVVKKERHSAGPVLRRLTHVQYNNTVRDLLGDDSRPADQFPPEDYVHGFKNQYEAQSISPLLADAYSAAAEKLARRAFSQGIGQKLIPCRPAGPDDATCRERFVRTFGRRAFRRPLSNEEASRYGALLRSEALRARSFTAGAQLVVEAMLQSPAFLFRTENGADPKLRPFEIASQLSYFLWNTMPDEALLQAAENGGLNRPEDVLRVTRRMLADARARAATDEFIAQWMRFDRVTSMVKDRRLFPIYSLELAVAMTEETRRLFSHLVWNNLNFMEFFSAPYSFITADLAAIYNLPAPKEEFGRVELPPSTGRAGIVGQAAFLALTSKPAETSPTARGLFVREQFLCQEVPQPPPGVSTNLPPLSPEKPQTNRERLAVHLSNESCASCHNLIDPIGFGLEKYDALGAYREKLKLVFQPSRKEKKKEPITVELDLDTSAHIAGLPNSAFTSPLELGTILARSPQCQQCVVKQLFRYAAGRKETAADQEIIARALDDFRASGFRFQELMASLMRWLIFPTEGS